MSSQSMPNGCDPMVLAWFKYVPHGEGQAILYLLHAHFADSYASSSGTTDHAAAQHRQEDLLVGASGSDVRILRIS